MVKTEAHNYMWLTSGRLLTRNMVFNTIGQGAPMIVAFFTIPLLIKGLGTDRFGILTLAWVVVGYFTLFDFGLGRALTKLVAEKLSTRREQEIPTLVCTALFLMLTLGLAGTLVVSLISPWLVRDALKIPAVLQSETLHAFYLLALAIPVLVSTIGLQGVLKAYQRFGLIIGIRIPLGMFIFLGPLLVLPFSQSLFSVVAVLVAGLVIAWLVHFPLCFRVMPKMRQGTLLERAMVRPLLGFGSWMTVTNIINLIMIHLDRFLIGALISIAAVAYYATPCEVVTKLWFIPGAMVGVLFPAFSTSFAQDPTRTVLLFYRGVKYLFLLLFPISLLIVTFAHEGLELWLGAEFARNSTGVLQWLAVGVFINSLAYVPLALLQGVGRPDLSAKLHIAELPFYLIAVWWMIMSYGIEGAAVAWVARMTVDALILFTMTKRLLTNAAVSMWRMVFVIGAVISIFITAVLLTGTAMKVLFTLLILLVFILATWFFILAPEEKSLLQNRLKEVCVFN